MPDCTLFTIGHSTRSFAEFSALLRAHAIELLIDVRTVPRSKHNPQFNAEDLSAALLGEEISYVQQPALGGWRRPLKDSPNSGWRLASFRGYADYMLTAEFRTALNDLVVLGCCLQAAIMCAEAVPWRCHRSLIADALVVRGWRVTHIISATKTSPHSMTSFARVDGAVITYPPAIEGA